MGLKAGKSCIDHSELDLATILFQRAAAYVETRDREILPTSKEHNQDNDLRETVVEDQIAEYYLLRGALAWKSDRIDLVEYWLSKVVVRSDRVGAAILVEKKADLLYEIGKAALKVMQYGVAAKWLEKSYDTIATLDQEALRPDCVELRSAIITDWGK